MFSGIEIITSNLYMSFVDIITLVVMLGSLIFFAKDIRLGFIYLFVMSTGLFIWFYGAGYEFVHVLVIMFISLVLLALSVYFEGNNENGGLI